MRRFFIAIAAALVLSFAAAPAAAQNENGIKADAGKKARKRFEKMRKKLLRDKLGLTEDKAQQVEDIMRRHAPQRRQIQRAVRQARRQLKRLFREDSDDQQAYENALKALHKAHGAMAKLRDSQMIALHKALTPKEHAKLLVAMEKVKRHMQRKRMKHKMKNKKKKKDKRERRGPPRDLEDPF